MKRIWETVSGIVLIAPIAILVGALLGHVVGNYLGAALAEQICRNYDMHWNPDKKVCQNETPKK